MGDNKRVGEGRRERARPRNAANGKSNRSRAAKIKDDMSLPDKIRYDGAYRPRRKRVVKKGPMGLILDGIKSVFKGINFPRNFLKRYGRPIVVFGTGFVVLFLLIFGTIWFFTNKNAYEVFVGEKHVGFMAYDKKVTKEDLYNNAVMKLTNEIGMKLEIKESVDIVRKHVSKKELSQTEYIIKQIADSFSYLVEATVITVNGKEMAVLKSDEEVAEVIKKLQEPYIPQDLELIASETDFVEDVKPIKKFVSKEDLITKESAYTLLSASSETEAPYVVAKGDSLWKITDKAGITMDELIAINPEITPDTVLKVGQQINLMYTKPMLSVKTVREVKQIEPYEKKTEIQENSNLYKTHKKVLKVGQDGQKEVTYHITMINSFEEEKKEISFTTIVEPVNEVIEVGTRQTPNSR